MDKDPICQCQSFKHSLCDMLHQIVTTSTWMNEPFMCLPPFMFVALPVVDLPSELPTDLFLVPGNNHAAEVKGKETSLVPLPLQEKLDKDSSLKEIEQLFVLRYSRIMKAGKHTQETLTRLKIKLEIVIQLVNHLPWPPPQQPKSATSVKKATSSTPNRHPHS